MNFAILDIYELFGNVQIVGDLLGLTKIANIDFDTMLEFESLTQFYKTSL